MGENGFKAAGLENPIADDIVAIKYLSGIVPRDHHGNSLRYEWQTPICPAPVAPLKIRGLKPFENNHNA
jgi:hypothetical protein